MIHSLTCKEVQSFSQIIYRVNQTSSYNEYCKVALELIRTTIPYKKGLITRSNRKNGLTEQYDLYCINPEGLAFDESRFTNGEYRATWTEYLFCPWSTVFRRSDIQDDATFVRTKQYKEMYQPQDLYYGLYTTIVHHDHPLGLLALFRSKEESDFSEREEYLMGLLKIHLEHKLYTLLNQFQSQSNACNVSLDGENVDPYNLTKREQEIISHIRMGETDEEISNLLYISRGTLRRHIYNIYKKIDVKSRVQLFKKFE